MKNFFRALFLLIAIFSLVGIFFIVAYYIYKNVDLFKKFLNGMGDKLADCQLDEKEVDALTDEIIRIEENIGADVKKDIKKAKKDLPKKFESVVSVVSVKGPEKAVLNARQKEVLNYVKLNSNSKMSSVSKVFNKVTPRTLRRDLQKLEQLGFLRQEGKTRDAIYKIV